MIDFTLFSLHDLVEQAAITGILEAVRHTPGQCSELPAIEAAIRTVTLREASTAQLHQALLASIPPDDDLLPPLSL